MCGHERRMCKAVIQKEKKLRPNWQTHRRRGQNGEKGRCGGAMDRVYDHDGRGGVEQLGKEKIKMNNRSRKLANESKKE